MSLTRQEWEMMWISLKEIERNAKALNDGKLINQNKLRSVNILRETEFVKGKIQQVIGQME